VESIRLGLPTLLLICGYLAGINLLGAWIGRRQVDARDYFLGSHQMPWWAVMASIVATETSALTFLSVPGDAYRSGYRFLQLVLGYVLGRILVSALLLPAYFKRELSTVYELLQTRFGPGARRFTSILFMVARALAAAVRLAVPAIPIALLLRVPVWVAILVLAAATGLYTVAGGLKAVIWIDLIQVTVYLSGAVIALVFLLRAIPGGFAGALAANAAAGQPARWFDLSFDFSRPYTLWSGIVGGAVLTMATHGADQLIVQRLFACRGLKDAQKALIGSGILVFAQMTLFVTIGVCLFAFFGGRAVGAGGFASPDEIFPAFIVRHLPAALSAYLVAGIFSAAMCSEASALNSLASVLGHDVLVPVAGAGALEGRRGLATGRKLTVLWTFLVAALAAGFSRLGQGQPAVQVALGLLSVTGGALLGAFLLAIYVRRARESDAIWAIGTSAVLMMAVWLSSKGWLPFALGRRIAWPWYSLIGAGVALLVGLVLSRSRPAPPPGHASAGR
jgi:SSS family solute:Na+ symporter